MIDGYICDAGRTPFGRFGGAFFSVRPDDLASLPIKALMDTNTPVDWSTLDDITLGCANQAGEDNRNVARMALLLAGSPVVVPGNTLNRLCGSGMDAVGSAARAIKFGRLPWDAQRAHQLPALSQRRCTSCIDAVVAMAYAPCASVWDKVSA